MVDPYVVAKLKEVAPLFHKYPSPISVTTRMAQFVLESQAGRSPLFKVSNNAFGIKASYPWTGDRVAFDSWEVGGVATSYFRVYESLEASIADHAGFFTSTEYRALVAYKKAIKARTYREECLALAGVYAGDKDYGRKLLDLIERYRIYEYEERRECASGLDLPQGLILIDRRDRAMGGQAVDRALADIDCIVWHYTAVARRLNRRIEHHERYWREDKGWDRGGYHYYIDSQALIYWNYDWSRITYGVAGHNGHCLHISVEAGSGEDYSQAQVEARQALTLALMKALNLSAWQVKGHWEVNPNTLCPGYSKSQMDEFRRELDRMVCPCTCPV